MNCKDCKKKDTCEILLILRSAGVNIYTEHNCNHFEENREYKAFNVNNPIRFKINQKYEKRICKYWSDIYREEVTLDYLFGKEDENGYRACQMWKFIEYIAPFICIGEEPPVDTTVYFETKHLYEETK